MAGSLEMKLHLSVRSSHSLILLGIIFIGWSTGVLWPVNGFLLNYLVGFIVTLCAILIVASVIWCASTFYILACRPFLKLLKFKKKLTFMRPIVPDDVTPIVTASAALDGTTAGKWIGVAVLTGVVALWCGRFCWDGQYVPPKVSSLCLPAGAPWAALPLVLDCVLLRGRSITTTWEHLGFWPFWAPRSPLCLFLPRYSRQSPDGNVGPDLRD